MSDELYVTDYRLQHYLAGLGYLDGKEPPAGSSTYIGLSDATTVDLTTVNGPLNTTLTNLTQIIEGLDTAKQDVLTPGDNITITDNVISASGVTTYAALTDKATVDLPAVNTLLNSALAGKQSSITSDTDLTVKSLTTSGGDITVDGGVNARIIVASDSISTIGSLSVNEQVSARNILFIGNVNALDYYDTTAWETEFSGPISSSETFTFQLVRIGKTATLSLSGDINFTATDTAPYVSVAEIPSDYLPSKTVYFTFVYDNGTTLNTVNTGSIEPTTGILSLGIQPYTSGTAYVIHGFSTTYNII